MWMWKIKTNIKLRKDEMIFSNVWWAYVSFHILHMGLTSTQWAKEIAGNEEVKPSQQQQQQQNVYRNVRKWHSYFWRCSNMNNCTVRASITYGNELYLYIFADSIVFKFKNRAEKKCFFLSVRLFAHYVSWTRAAQLLLNHFIHFYRRS